MPIVDVEMILAEGESISRNLAKDLADAVGDVFRSPPGHTWVRVRALADHEYGENGAVPTDPVFPVFVTVLKAHLPPPEPMGKEVSGLTEAVARVCGRARENVHILYLPEAAGRLAFGGKIVGESASDS